MRPRDHAVAVADATTPEAIREELARLRSRLIRERAARVEAEQIAERATRELYTQHAELRLLETVASAANHARVVDQALQVALDQVCAHAGWPLGHVYLRETASSDALIPTKIWHDGDPPRYERFRAVTERRVLSDGVGLPGQVALSAAATWVQDVTVDPQFSRTTAAREVGIRAAFAAPILVESEVTGVLEFFTDVALEPDERLLSVIALIGTQLGRVIERHRGSEQLAAYRDQLERLVHERTAALSASNRELQAFSYSVSHDLRAPLRAIDGFSQALLEDYGERLDEQGHDYLNRVRNATQRMGDLIDGLLLLAQVSRGDLRRGSIDLSALSREIVAELNAGDPGRELQWEIAEDLIVSGDERMVRLLLQNLIGNAWKFTARKRSAKIEIGVSNQQGELAYYVRDDGAGFDMTYAEKLFGPFQRLHHAAEFPGTGIGLATVQRIASRHAGRVWAEGSAGHGATFWFTLPAPPDHA